MDVRQSPGQRKCLSGGRRKNHDAGWADHNKSNGSKRLDLIAFRANDLLRQTPQGMVACRARCHDSLDTL